MVQQRRVPVKAWQSCGVWAVVVALLSAAGCLIFLGVYGSAGSSLAVGGVALAILALAIVALMVLRLRPVRVDASAEARIVRRTKDELQIAAGGASLVDLILAVGAWSYAQARPSYEYTVVFVFEAADHDGIGRKITLAAKVPGEIYRRYEPGAVVGIAYATADPSYAVVEGERAYDRGAVFEPEVQSDPHELEEDAAPEGRIEAARPPLPGNDQADDETDQGAVAGILCGLAAAALGVFLSVETTMAAAGNFPVACLPVAALYCVPLGIGGARLGERIGRMNGSAPRLIHSVAGSVLGGVLGFGISAVLVRLFLVMGM